MTASSASCSASWTPGAGWCRLGADRADILRLMLKQGLSVTVIGAALGIVGAVALTRLFKSQLVGVSATDGASYVLMTMVLVAVALLATYLPARRAASVDPLTALRHD